MNIEVVTTVATTDTSRHKETLYIKDDAPGGLDVVLLANRCDKDGIGRTLSSYSCWKKYNMGIPLGERGIRILFELDE